MKYWVIKTRKSFTQTIQCFRIYMKAHDHVTRETELPRNLAVLKPWVMAFQKRNASLLDVDKNWAK